MSTPRGPFPRMLLFIVAGIATLTLLVASMDTLVGGWNSASSTQPILVTDGIASADDRPAPPPSTPVPAVLKPAVPIQPSGQTKRFALRLGQGFRFKDGAVVKPEDGADLVFKYLPPQVGGMALRYNPISQQVEQGLEPTLTAPVPLLLSTHISAFEQRPNVARTTTGDVVTWQHQAPIASKTRYVLLQNPAGDCYLLTLDELEAVAGKYDDWRIGFSYEPVQLPLGLAGGKINAPLPGKLIFRDWYRSKMIVRVDLTTGTEETLADGTLPSVAGDRLGYGDSTSAYIIRDPAGKTLHTLRLNEQVLGPLLAPDGTRLVGSVYRPGPGVKYGDTVYPGPAVLSLAVFDLSGRELLSVVGHDDATWTPDGKLIATGSLYDAGLFEIDPDTKQIRPIDPRIATPLQPCISPDGKTIAFVTGDKVWLIDRDGKNLRQLFPHGTKQQRPAFSPDGTKIALILCNHLGNDTTGDVAVIDLATRQITELRTNTGLSLVPDTSTRLNWVR